MSHFSGFSRDKLSVRIRIVREPGLHGLHDSGLLPPSHLHLQSSVICSRGRMPPVFPQFGCPRPGLRRLIVWGTLSHQHTLPEVKMLFWGGGAEGGPTPWHLLPRDVEASPWVALHPDTFGGPTPWHMLPRVTKLVLRWSYNLAPAAPGDKASPWVVLQPGTGCPG